MKKVVLLSAVMLFGLAVNSDAKVVNEHKPEPPKCCGPGNPPTCLPWQSCVVSEK